MDTLSLIIPGPEHEAVAEAYAHEFLAAGETVVHGGSGLGRADYSTYDAWLRKLENGRLPEPGPGLVTADVYFGVRSRDNAIVGVIAVRHRLNETLFNLGGHIGYSVRPSERRRGYAKQMLHLALNRCRQLGLERALVTCDPANIASARTIEACGGMLEDIRTDPGTGTQVRRYWVTL